MKNVQQRQQHSLELCREFLDAHAPQAKEIAAFRVQLAAVVERLARLASRQGNEVALQRWQAREMVRLRNLLRVEHLLRIARPARALLRNQPRREEMLRVPHKRANSDVVVAFSKALAKWLVPFVPAFLKVGFQKDFLKRLRAATRELQKAARLVSAAERGQTTTTAAIARELRRGYEIKMAIDGLLMPYFATDRDLRTGWERAKRVGRKTGRPRAKQRKRRGDAPG